MTHDEAVAALEQVENFSDALHKALREVEAHLKEHGFSVQYQAQVDAIVERLKELDAMADAARVKICSQR